MGRNRKKKASKGASAAVPEPAALVHLPATQRANEYPQWYEGAAPARGRFVTEDDAEFAELLGGAYEGMVVDGPEKVDERTHVRTEAALAAMDRAGLFQTDVTQPFGLGTKLAPTFVTRCLVGEPGTTYRYLGLRMFAHPMAGYELSAGVRGVEDPQRREELRQALHDMGKFNADMVRRGEQHLRALSAARVAYGGEEAVGSSRFNIMLINRMAPAAEAHKPLKHEPMFEADRCSVSWHADSSLEHFSTIGVYHTLLDAPAAATKRQRQQPAEASEWRVAVRVAHDAEGPTAGKLGSAGSAGLAGAVQDTPPLAVALPSRATYFMLDSFNHHHQHAVLAGSDKTRFSVTHRVLRPGHTFAELDERCRSVVGDFHRRGVKVWRAEQLVLDELEFEWLRQFYVQGAAHRRALGWWAEPMAQLLAHWARLEHRTFQVLTTLRLAAEHAADKAKAARGAAAGAGPREAPAEIDRKARKLQDRRRKAAETVAKLGDRAGEACEMLAEMLEARAEKRRLWHEREQDPAFERMPADRRPLPLPVLFGRVGSQGDPAGDGRAQSPLPEDLAAVAAEMRRLSMVLQGHSRRVPRPSALELEVDWAGEARVGLEVQEPFAGMLLRGEKPAETRAYPLPEALVGRPVDVVRSAKGEAGRSAVPDALAAGAAGLEVAGRVEFGSCTKYETREAWLADEARHRVPADSPYAWTEERPLYAWHVAKAEPLATPAPVPAMRRLHRSLFRLGPDPEPEPVDPRARRRRNKRDGGGKRGRNSEAGGAAGGKRKKKRRF